MPRVNPKVEKDKYAANIRKRGLITPKANNDMALVTKLISRKGNMANAAGAVIMLGMLVYFLVMGDKEIDMTGAKKWSRSDVCAFLDDKGFPELCERFQLMSVDGKKLLRMSAVDLSDLQVPYHRRATLQLHIDKLKSRTEEQCPGAIRRLFVSPFTEGTSSFFRGIFHLSGSDLFDSILWLAVYPGLELFSVIGAVAPPTCGGSRYATCDSFPCYKWFDEDKTPIWKFVDLFLMPFILMGACLRLCSGVGAK